MLYDPWQDRHRIDFLPVIADVEELNQQVASPRSDITKLSYHAFAFPLKNYALLDAGSALGNNVEISSDPLKAPWEKAVRRPVLPSGKIYDRIISSFQAYPRSPK